MPIESDLFILYDKDGVIRISEDFWDIENIIRAQNGTFLKNKLNINKYIFKDGELTLIRKFEDFKITKDGRFKYKEIKEKE